MLTLEEISPIEIQALHENTPELWNAAVLALEERYNSNPNETETILHLGHIYWFLVFEEGVWNCTLDYRTMQQSLFELYHHAKIVLRDNVEFLWSFAWMMERASYYFFEYPGLNEERHLILSMYSHAVELEPDNPFPIWSGWGGEFFKDLEPSIMLEHCKQGIKKIYVDKVFENRGRWGCYFESAILGMIQTYLGYTEEQHMPARDAYIQQVIDEATKDHG